MSDDRRDLEKSFTHATRLLTALVARSGGVVSVSAEELLNADRKSLNAIPNELTGGWDIEVITMSEDHS